jgi:hypothetical protein
MTIVEKDWLRRVILFSFFPCFLCNIVAVYIPYCWDLFSYGTRCWSITECHGRSGQGDTELADWPHAAMAIYS